MFAAPKHWQTLHSGAFILDLHKSKAKSSLKTSVPVRLEILGLFGNTLTGDHMNSPYHTDKLRQVIQRQLFQKRKRLS